MFQVRKKKKKMEKFIVKSLIAERINECGQGARMCLYSRCYIVLAFPRIAVFSVTVFYDERIVIVAEQRPDASEEDSFQWMSRVLQVRFLSSSHSRQNMFFTGLF